MHVANYNYNFQDDIDNSEEEELTDDELRVKIKDRKQREKARRDDLTVTKTAAIATANAVERVRKLIPASSILENCINLEALKLRQGKLRKEFQSEISPSKMQPPKR